MSFPSEAGIKIRQEATATSNKDANAIIDKFNVIVDLHVSETVSRNNHFRINPIQR